LGLKHKDYDYDYDYDYDSGSGYAGLGEEAMTMQTLRLTMLCMVLNLANGAIAAELPFDLGKLGEVPAWLIVKMPEWRMEVDPLAPMGGEAKYAAMSDPKLIPVAGMAFEIPGTNAGAKVRIGDGVWEGVKMVLPEMPGIWNEFPRLVMPEGYRYAYCRLDSPTNRSANLLTGANRGKYRIYLNGREAGTFDGGWGWEFSREVPIELKQGANHVLVRFTDAGNFACRLVGENAEPLREVKVVVQAPNAAALKAPEPPPVQDKQRLVNRAKAIPPPAPPAHPELLGAKLGRTMALLESGRYTHRPLRVVFSGQSIETEWTWMLIQRLRERYPGTQIVVENRALGGWFVWRMQKLLKHDILRWQPDLVLFSAYQGTAEVWERFLGELRSETTADIVIRTHHLGGREKPEDSPENAETILMRRLAAEYDVELIEVRREWSEYLTANALASTNLLRDGIHLNEKGETLMALLYERHFTPAAPGRQGWAKTVRRFDVGRFTEDNHSDEIVLEGAGWSGGRVAKSNSADDRLRLTFHGNRVDLVMPTTHGRARVLIDGKKPSELNLYHGTRPQDRTMTSGSPNAPMTYHTGRNMQAETWVLTVTEGNVDPDPKKANQRLKFKLTGSKTGFDGEGWNDRKFVSNSGRITLLPSDWATQQEPVAAGKPAPEMKALGWQSQIVWHILPDGLDEVPHGPGWREAADYYSGQPYDYLTVADGLPCGVHELTLIPIPDPNANRAFTIVGVDAHCPPLARDVAQRTVKE
jgi:hypothetical protein